MRFVHTNRYGSHPPKENNIHRDALYSMHQQTAFAVQAELKKIGIDVTLDLPDWATRIEKNTKGEYDFLVAGKRISKSPGILEFPVRNND